MFDSKRKRLRNQAAGAVIRMAEKAEETVGEEGILDDYKRAAARQSAEEFEEVDTGETTKPRSGEGFREEPSASGGGFGAFRQANRAQSGADQAVNLVVALVVGGLMAAFLLPIAIDEIATVDTSSWTSGASAMWEILPVMIVLAIFLFFVGVALRRSGRI